jgi:hypothetical protein
MASESDSHSSTVLEEVLRTLKALQTNQTQLASAVGAINNRLDALPSTHIVHESSEVSGKSQIIPTDFATAVPAAAQNYGPPLMANPTSLLPNTASIPPGAPKDSLSPGKTSSTTSRIILT